MATNIFVVAAAVTERIQSAKDDGEHRGRADQSMGRVRVRAV
jgi:hypothetical protein